MDLGMIICKSIDVPAWDEQTISKVRQYWEKERGFRLEPSDAATFSGKRGSWWGTLGSVSFSQVLTELRIHHDGSRLDCSLHVDTRFRTVTLWHRKQLDLELATFKSFLLTGDRLENAWAEHYRESKHALSNAVADNVGHLFSNKKPDRPMQVGGDLIFKVWLLFGTGALSSLVFLMWGNEIFKWLHTFIKRRPADSYISSQYLSVIAAVFMGFMFTIMAAVMYQMWRTSRKCVSVESAAASLGLDSDSVLEAIALRGIKAKFIVDGEPVYDLGDLTGTATLLRPAGDGAQETLLQPVNNVTSRTDGLLVRPIDSVETETDQIANRP